MFDFFFRPLVCNSLRQVGQTACVSEKQQKPQCVFLYDFWDQGLYKTFSPSEQGQFTTGNCTRDSDCRTTCCGVSSPCLPLAFSAYSPSMPQLPQTAKHVCRQILAITFRGLPDASESCLNGRQPQSLTNIVNIKTGQVRSLLQCFFFAF